MIEKGWSRSTINQSIGRIRRCFKWAVENERVRPDMYHGLMAVSGLRKGRSEAREADPVQPVDDATVQDHIAPSDARGGGYDPFSADHGMSPAGRLQSAALRHRHFERMFGSTARTLTRPSITNGPEIIPIGPKGQDILRPYLLREKESHCFRPVDSEKQRRAEQHANRTTPLSYGNRPGTNRKRKPKRTAGERYTTESYRRAIHRACDLAFPAPEPLCRRDDESIRELAGAANGHAASRT